MLISCALPHIFDALHNDVSPIDLIDGRPKTGNV
jgi:hypothetical protein